jgi:hypothetical protein
VGFIVFTQLHVTILAFMNPSRLLFLASHPNEADASVLEWLKHNIVSKFWDNPVLLREAVRVWRHCGGSFEDGVYLTRDQFEQASQSLASPLSCGKLIVHMASSTIMDIPRVPCPKQSFPSILNVENLVSRHASTVRTSVNLRDAHLTSFQVSFDKTSDAFLHAILRMRLEPHRLALCGSTEMPYQKISEQLTTDANEELGPIIDEPIENRVRRIDWDTEEIDPELSMLAIHIVVELLQIATPRVSLRAPCFCVHLMRVPSGFGQQHDGV